MCRRLMNENQVNGAVKVMIKMTMAILSTTLDALMAKLAATFKTSIGAPGIILEPSVWFQNPANHWKKRIRSWRHLRRHLTKQYHFKKIVKTTWWRHQMEAFSALLAICAGNSPVPANSPHKGQWRGALMFSVICVWINGLVNNRKAVYLRRYRAHYDITLMYWQGNHENNLS